MRQFHKAGDEKRTPVIIPQENYIQWIGADLPTANQTNRYRLLGLAQSAF
jgi:hypothetical protein